MTAEAPAQQNHAEQPVSEWTEARLIDHAKAKLTEAENGDKQARDIGNKAVAAYLSAGQAFTILRTRNKAERNWTVWLASQGLTPASVDKCIAFSDKAHGHDLHKCESLTAARKELGLLDAQGQPIPRTQKPGNNAGNIRGMPRLKQVEKSLSELVKAIATKKHGSKIASAMKWDDAKIIADKLREDLAKLDEWLASGSAAAEAAKSQEQAAKEAVAA